MRTIVATAYTPSLDSGRARRAYGLMRALATHGPLDVVYSAFGADQVDPAVEAIEGIRLHRIDRSSSLARIPTYLRARASRIPAGFARGIWPGVSRRVGELAAESGESRIVAEGPIAAGALLDVARARPTVYSAQNLESTYRHRLTLEGISREAMLSFEHRLLETFEETWMVSPADVAGAEQLAPGSRIRLVPNVVDVAAIRPIPPRDGQRTMLFLADFSYEPNRQGLDFLIDSVMPSLAATDPGVRLVVAGRGSDTHRPGADPRVETRGFVDDLDRLYAEAGCVVVPLIEGGGSPLKFVEALAYGAPIVATPRAAAGLEIAAGREYLEAPPDGEPFAAAVTEALDPERARSLGAAARRLAEEKYSIEALARMVRP